MYTKITEANRSVRLERVSPRPPALRRISCLVAGSVAKTSPRATAAKNRSACSARGGGLTLDALAVCWPRARMVDAAPVAEEAEPLRSILAKKGRAREKGRHREANPDNRFHARRRARRAAVNGAPLLWRRVRRAKADHVDGRADEDRVDEPAHAHLPRRQRRAGQRRQ